MVTVADIWGYVGVGAALVEARALSLDVHEVKGLNHPLVVAPLQRSAGAMNQTVAEAAGTVTVERT